MTDRRLVAAMGKMGADNENERLIGLTAATAILKARGLSWPDVAEMITGRTLADITAPEGSRISPQAQPAASGREKPPGRLSGAAIPAKITGRVRILEEGPGLIIVDMMGTDWWGPMRVSQPKQIENVRLAADRGNPREITVITAHAGGDAIVDVIDVKVRFAGAWNG